MRRCFVYLMPALFALATGCGSSTDDSAEQRQFSLGDPVEDEAIMQSLLRSPSGDVRHAAQIKVQVDHSNAADLDRLSTWLHARAVTDPSALVAQASALIDSERPPLVALQQHLDRQSGDDRGLPQLRTSLVKLLGTDTRTGILDDAKTLLAESGSDLARGLIPSPAPKHNRLTVTKAAQLFLAMASTSQPLRASPDLVDGVELLYPASLPSTVPATIAHSPQLAAYSSSASSLLVPNAGYIFGGSAIGDRIRGFDCSAYLSMATDSSVRLSTEVMEYAWREQRGESFEADDPDGHIREQMHAGAGLTQAEAEYEAIAAPDGGSIREADLQLGDLVVWRYPQRYPTTSGHVAMFVGHEGTGGAEGEFLGLEATRADDKTREGVLLSRFTLDAADAYVFVLRRRPH